MSILRKPYEIAVYDDVLVDGVLQEKRLGIIGSDKMLYQGRALQPNLVRNVNGQNSLTFQMYKKYIDNVTGEKVVNSFSDWLINERKIKLYYDNKWYDFIIKDINENSSNYLYTYQLEDANVQELSKNGFGITLDVELMNNIGDSVTLGQQVMEQTDWQVDGDVIVEQVDEALVYVTIPAGTTAIHLFDQTQDATGNYSVGLEEQEDTTTFTESKTVLAFYSSCTNKPHRFQFIYSANGYDKNIDEEGKITYNISRKDDRTINEKDCQYYIDFDIPEQIYKKNVNGLYLPDNWDLAVPATSSEGNDSQVSTWYRGKRYGFAQQSEYLPLLERYCQKYEKDGEEYYGYVDSNYISPTIVENYISNYNFEGSSGWTATSLASSVSVPTIENIYARNDGTFTPITDDFLNGQYQEKDEDNSNPYSPYMKMTFYKSHGEDYVLNSCIKDNRTIIEDLPVGTELVLDYEILNNSNETVDNFSFSLSEFIYSPSTGKYEEERNNIRFIATKEKEGRIIFKVASSIYDKDTFKKNSKIFLKIYPLDSITVQEGKSYYISKIALYKKALGKDGKIITPDYEDLTGTAIKDMLETSCIQKEYKFFLASSLDNIQEADKIQYITESVLNYGIYKPIYNIGGVKIRSVNVKESNYFNVLQTIAETFEQWLVINIDRNDDGSIKPNGKKISFKNYRGDDNYACFRYGVNLKDIQRTNTSKNIVSKLIVKQNSNELAEDGFCTIQRAGANPTGENYIYDFQYYHNTGIMDPGEYLQTNYYLNGAIGEDLKELGESIFYEKEFQTAIEPHYGDNAPEPPRDPYYAYTSKSDFCRLDKLQNNISNNSKKLYTFSLSYEWDASNAVDKIIVSKDPEGNEKIPWNLPENMAIKWEIFGSWYSVKSVPLNQTTGSILFYFTVPGSKFFYDNNERQSTFIRAVETRRNKYNSWIQEIPEKRYIHTYINESGEEDLGGPGITLKNVELKLVSTTIGDGNIPSLSDPQYANTNVNGYFPRLKNLNNQLVPISKEINGYSGDLVKEKAKLEVAKNTIEAATQGLQQTREDFRTLTGIYPESLIKGDYILDSEQTPVIESKEDWYTAEPTIKGNGIELTVKLIEPGDIKIETYDVTFSDDEKALKLSYTFKENERYKISCELEIDSGLGILSFNGYEWNNSIFKVSTDGEQIEQQYYIDNSYYRFTEASNEKKLYKIEFEGTFTNKNNQNFYIYLNKGLTPVNCTSYSVTNLTELSSIKTSTEDRLTSTKVKVFFNEGISRIIEIPCIIPANKTEAKVYQAITPVDMNRSDVKKYLQEYIIYKKQYDRATIDKNNIEPIINKKLELIKEKEEEYNRLFTQKSRLNQKFFERYSRFIQEGTWINEECVDDDKYYTDAQSVLYNSCYPQVSYNINVLELSQLPGYELFKFNLGDKTYVIDDDFFGDNIRQEIIITEISENLDEPNNNIIKVQNFKNQFQDLFQKITATVQQTQYNVGSYEKGAALIDASTKKRNEFITNAINDASTFLAPGKSHDVVWDESGITVTEAGAPTNQVRIVGGAILLSAEDPKTKEQSWVTGLTNKGISANLVTAGQLNTDEISIMSGNDPTFKWDSYGISAYDNVWYNEGEVSSITGVDTKKFVRYDKYGIYGINNVGNIDGKNWHPNNQEEIDNNATFALTWDGLKVTQGKATARIGNYENTIIKVNNGTTDTFAVDKNGNVTVRGDLKVGDGRSVEDVASEVGDAILQLGERNLILNSANPQIVTIQNNAYYGTISNYGREVLSNGGKVTIFFKARIAQESVETDNDKVNIDTYPRNIQNGALTQYIAAFTVGSDWTDCSACIELPNLNSGYGYWTIRSNSSAANGFGSSTAKIEIKEIILVYGEKTVKWSIAPEDMDTELQKIESNTQNLINQVKEDLQSQIDGAIDTWFYEGIPTTNNLPAKDWTTTEDKNKHLGDLYYDTETQYCYRWSLVDGEYRWSLVLDNAVAEALAAAAAAQSTADGKMTVFTGTETPSSTKIGDLWLDGDEPGTQTLKTFDGSEWVLATKYTDDTELNKFIKDDFTPYKKQIQSQIDNKAETWYQNNNPSVNWTDDETKAKHIGDLWHDTDDNKEYIYQFDDNKSPKYFWTEMEVPNEVFDKIDGKATIYVTKPSNYRQKDLWILDANTQQSNDCPIDNNGTKYKEGTLLVAIGADTANYNKAHWQEKTRYTDDTLAQSKMDPEKYGAYSWKFNENLGLMMWSGVPKYTEDSDDYGDFAKDSNMVFKVGKTNEDEPYLKLRGSGEFTGKITATSGEIGGWSLSENNLKAMDSSISSDSNLGELRHKVTKTIYPPKETISKDQADFIEEFYCILPFDEDFSISVGCSGKRRNIDEESYGTYKQFLESGTFEEVIKLGEQEDTQEHSIKITITVERTGKNQWKILTRASVNYDGGVDVTNWIRFNIPSSVLDKEGNNFLQNLASINFDGDKISSNSLTANSLTANSLTANSLTANSYNEIFLNPTRIRNDEYESWEQAEENTSPSELLDSIDVRLAINSTLNKKKNIVKFDDSGYTKQNGGYSLEEIIYALVAKVKELQTEVKELKK